MRFKKGGLDMKILKSILNYIPLATFIIFVVTDGIFSLTSALIFVISTIGLLINWKRKKQRWRIEKIPVYWEVAENEKSEVVVKEVYNGVLDFFVVFGFASSIYDDWFWKIFYEKGSKGNKFSIWISDFDVYEEQRHMGICS